MQIVVSCYVHWIETTAFFVTFVVLFPSHPFFISLFPLRKIYPSLSSVLSPHSTSLSVLFSSSHSRSLASSPTHSLLSPIQCMCASFTHCMYDAVQSLPLEFEKWNYADCSHPSLRPMRASQVRDVQFCMYTK